MYYLRGQKTPNENTKQGLEALNKWYETAVSLHFSRLVSRRRVFAWQALGGTNDPFLL